MPLVDSKGKVRETAYCQYLLEKHPMMCLKQKLFDQNGEVDEDALLYEVHSDLRDFVLDNLAKKEKQVLDALRIETYIPEWKPQLDRIHLQNGTYFLDERGFVPEKELCLNRLPVEYQPDAPAPTKWLEFLDGLLIPEDILTLQEYLGYLLIPSTKAQKMLVMTGKGGEGKSRIGLLLKKLFGEASHSESILRIETNRFASANLEYKLVMVDDDLNMVLCPKHGTSSPSSPPKTVCASNGKTSRLSKVCCTFVSSASAMATLWLLTMTATASGAGRS